MKTYLHLFLFLLIVAPGVPAFADTNIYVGGSADGYDDVDAAPRIDYPYVQNANGATNITDQSAWMNGILVSTGMTATTVHVYWDTEDDDTNKTTWAYYTNFGVRAEGEALTTNVTGLNPNTTYYYRFYATNENGEFWAEPAASFTTFSQPSVNNGWGAGPISFTTAGLSGNLTGGISADVYIYWGTDNVGEEGWAKTNNLGTLSEGAFHSAISGLSEGGVYYYRCYATNDYGEDWSDVVTVTTLVSFAVWDGGDADGYDDIDAVPGMDYPYVHNANGATNITDQSAWLNGILVSTGMTATTVHVYWDTEDEDTNKTAWAYYTNFGVRAEGESLTTNVTGLNPNTTYYYRFNATNENGEFWAESAASFTTFSQPSVNNGWGAGPISFTTAGLSGNLTGGISADVYIYWGTDNVGEEGWAKTNSLGTLSEGAFHSAISGLSEGGVYYYRCYATNDYGEDWSDVVTLTTLVSFAVWDGGDAAVPN